MGRYVILALHGSANLLRGFPTSDSSSVLRLRSLPGPQRRLPEDFIITHSRQELKSAAEAGIDATMIVSDERADSWPETVPFSRVISVPAKFDYLSDGDILGLHPRSRRFRTLYRQKSGHNSFLVTDRCNHYCVMCSQPPKDIDDRWILDEIKSALPLINKDTRSLGFTGGEPLLDWPEFVNVLDICRDELPNTAIHVLSNGRAFGHDEVVKAWAGIRHPNLTVGIPIYAAVDYVHDHVVQAHGAFSETVLGVLKLKNSEQRVEIRVVLHALTAPRIVETCKWFARNLPFVDHVALMGLENTGFAIANAEALWIDPIDYQSELAHAVDTLVSAGMNVSVYNLQRCLLHKSVWPFAAQSISDWKNGYTEDCNRCIEKKHCSGFFTTGRPRQSRGIRPILAAK
jgi:His-Xaa-Ser system radical SAM maturase HxsC